MFGFHHKEDKFRWCSCCDGKDDKCRCIHHAPWLRAVIRLVLFVVVLMFLVFIFCAGFISGRISSYQQGVYREGYSYMMPNNSQCNNYK
jgi:hypothetical protein